MRFVKQADKMYLDTFSEDNDKITKAQLKELRNSHKNSNAFQNQEDVKDLVSDIENGEPDLDNEEVE